MRVADKIKHQKGFSALELVAVVVILGILFAFAAPSLINWQKNLKLKELDDNARSIFMAAQSRLTSLHSTYGDDYIGTLGAKIAVPKASDGGTTNSGESSENAGGETPVPGSGSGSTEEGDTTPAGGETSDEGGSTGEGNKNEYQLRYVTNLPLYCLEGDDIKKANDDRKTLLPDGTIAPHLEKGYYVVEFDPEGATIFGVFYSEKEFTYRYTSDKYERENAFLIRKLEDRKSFTPLLGYYGTETVLRPEFRRLPQAKVEMTNGEELLLKVTIATPNPYPVGLEGNEWNKKVRMDVTLHGKNANGEDAALPIVRGADAHIDGEYTIALDTLKGINNLADSAGVKWYNSEADSETGTIYNLSTQLTGSTWAVKGRFKDWASMETSDEKSLVPGCDVYATVELYCVESENNSSRDDSYISSEITSGRPQNSLFEEIAENSKTAFIAYGRHLQNLDLSSWGDDVTTQKKNSEKITKAEQTKHIYFGDPKTEESEENSESELKSWKEIYNSKQFEAIWNGNLRKYDGNNYEICDLDAIPNSWAKKADTQDAAKKRAGLFSTFNVDAKDDSPDQIGRLENITLIDCKINGDGSDTGTLAGKTISTNITNCHVYLTKEKVKELKSTYPLSSYTDRYMVQGGSNAVGGLIGTMLNGTIENCSASTTLRGSSIIGGLVGQAGGNMDGFTFTGGDNTKELRIAMKNTYAACNLYKAGEGNLYVGGLVGYAKNGLLVIENCYAAGSIDGAQATGSGEVNGGIGGLIGWNISADNKTAGEVQIKNAYSATEISNRIATSIHRYQIFGATPPKPSYSKYSELVTKMDNVYYLEQNGVIYNTEGEKEFSDGGEIKSAKSISEWNNEFINAMKDSDKNKWINGNENLGVKGHPYQLGSIALVERYPYCALKNWKESEARHYGDWNENTAGDMGVFYWEKHDNDYALYTVGWSIEGEGFTKVDDLCRKYDCDKNITDYGYGLFWNKGRVGSVNNRDSKEITWMTTKEKKDDADVTGIRAALTDLYGDKYQLMVFNSEELQKHRKDLYVEGEVTTTNNGWLGWSEGKKNNQQLSQRRELVWNVNQDKPVIMNVLLNPDFAAAMKISVKLPNNAYKYKDSTDGFTDTTNDSTTYIGYWGKSRPYEVRNVSQLQNLNKYTINYIDVSQTHHIDGKNESFHPIGNKTNPFRGAYDGRYYQIKNLSIISDDVENVGLFGYTEGTVLQNIVMYSPQAQAQVRNSSVNEGDSNVGALVGVAKAMSYSISGKNRQGEVKNCAVAGYVVANDSVSNSVALGGLIGSSEVLVTNCSSDAAVVNTQQSSATTINMGGLIGSATGTIQNCYAGGVVYQGNKNEGSDKTIHQGGLIGSVGTSMLNINNVYSYCHLAWAGTSTANDKIQRHALWPQEIEKTGKNGYYYEVLASEAESYDAISLDYDGLRNLVDNEKHQLTGFGKTDEGHTHPVIVPDSHHEGSYPFPAVVKDKNEQYVHYGTWPVVNPLPQGDETNPFYLMDCEMIYGAEEFNWQSAASIKLYPITWEYGKKEGGFSGEPIVKLVDYTSNITENKIQLQNWIYLLVKKDFEDLRNWYFWNAIGSLDEEGKPVAVNTESSKLITIHDEEYYIAGQKSYANVGDSTVYFYRCADGGELPTNNWNKNPEDNCTFYITIPYKLSE